MSESFRGFYEIYVATNRYLKDDPLTYASSVKLTSGDVVVVPYGNREVLGFVVKESLPPDFETKPIVRIVKGAILPEKLVDLFNWLQDYYPGNSGASAQLLMPSGLLVENARETKARLKKLKTHELPKLTTEQTKALKIINAATGNRFLLHGETGSGKTRVYIERAKQSLAQNRSALILTPEIALTPQLKESFEGVFGNKVLIMHSELTSKKRREFWLKIAGSTEPLVVIGARSALFAPLKNIGLIVVDEFHEPAYKQEQAPRYQALRVAGTLAKIHDSEIIYGSATPLVAEYYLAEATKTPIIRMDKPATGEVGQAEIELVNLSNKDLFTRERYLSDIILDNIEATLQKKEQVLIYLNRRGTARLVICSSCGWQALCPNCDLPLTYHGDSHNMRCHTCGHRATPPFSCPVCSSTEIEYRTIGTKALVETLARYFPHANIKRFDTDLGVNDKIDKHFADIKAGNIDILVGTQMLGKGLDLPKLGLVGIVAADTSLYMPDFTAAERSYQLLHQVIGRVGRGHRDSRVVIQTYMPDNPVLQAAILKDYKSFYKAELIERKTFLFPPFCYLLKISVSRKTLTGAETAINKLHGALLKMPLKIRLSDPAPSFYEHTHGLYHWQLVLKSKDRQELIKAIKSLPGGDWVYDLDPANLL